MASLCSHQAVVETVVCQSVFVSLAVHPSVSVSLFLGEHSLSSANNNALRIYVFNNSTVFVTLLPSANHNSVFSSPPFVQTCSGCKRRQPCRKSFSIQRFPTILVIRILFTIRIQIYLFCLNWVWDGLVVASWIRTNLFSWNGVKLLINYFSSRCESTCWVITWFVKESSFGQFWNGSVVWIVCARVADALRCWLSISVSSLFTGLNTGSEIYCTTEKITRGT